MVNHKLICVKETFLKLDEESRTVYEDKTKIMLSRRMRQGTSSTTSLVITALKHLYFSIPLYYFH